MDSHQDLWIADKAAQRRETSIRDMLERSLQDIEAGRTVPMEPVMAHARAVAEGIRRGRAGKARAADTNVSAFRGSGRGF